MADKIDNKKFTWQKGDFIVTTGNRPKKKVEKGGAGSGNFGHSGRPGVQGGSGGGGAIGGGVSALKPEVLHRLDVLANVLVDKLNKSPVERGYVLNSEGDILATAIGKKEKGQDYISLDADPGEITVHSHPNSNPPSMMDLKTAAEDELQACVVVTRETIHIVEPGENGWRGTEAISQYDPHNLTLEIAEKAGLIYTQRPFTPGIYE